MTTQDNFAQQFDTFVKLYQAISSAVNAMQIPEKFKDYISMNFDQGFMWTKEAYQAVSAALANKQKEDELVADIKAEIEDVAQPTNAA